MTRGVLLMLGALLAGYVCYLGLLFVQQRSVMFPGASMDWDGVGRALPAHAEAVSIPVSFGQVQGVLLHAHRSPRRDDPAPAAPAPAAIFFHGNAEFVDQNVPLLEPLAAAGLQVLLVEFPGFADTDGRPSRATLDEAALKSYDWLATRRDVDATRIVVIGRSIGTGPAVALARQRPARAVVLMAAFGSLDDFAHRMGAPAFLLRDRYDNLALRDYGGPVLLFHGRDDDIIPYRNSEYLLKAAPNATLVPMACGHNDCPFFEPEFMERLRRFLVHSGVLASASNPRDAG